MEICWYKERYLGRGRKQISRSKAGSKNKWIGTTFGTEVMKIYCWRERNRAERAKATSRMKGNSGKQSRQGQWM